jgi:uncharacterized membrane protein YidH (DUF202 family)
MDLFFTNVAYASADSFLNNVNRVIINPIIVLLFAAALAYFAWGMIEFLTNQNSEEKKTAGKQHMIWGVVGLTIMMGVWTLLNIVLNTFGIDKSQINPKAGTVNIPESSISYPQVGN